MALLDDLKSIAKSKLAYEAKKAVNSAVNNVVHDATTMVGKGMNKTEKFKFEKLPTSVEELKALPEASLDSAFKTAALALAVLCNFKKDAQTTFDMLDVLRGPEPLSPKEKQFFEDRLIGKEYKSFSFFEGATPQNGYVPTQPYTISVHENPYSFDEENWAVLYVTSSGADSERPIKLRKKPSTGQWFINDIQCLADMRIPVSEDPWA